MIYRHRNDGRVVIISDCDVLNRLVISYNHDLTLRYDCVTRVHDDVWREKTFLGYYRDYNVKVA